MTLEQWWNQLIDPSALLTESIYNIIFEVIATYVFVRWSLRGIVRDIIKKEFKEKDE